MTYETKILWKILSLNNIQRIPDLFDTYFTSREQAQKVAFDVFSTKKGELKFVFEDEVALPTTDHTKYKWFGKLENVRKTELQVENLGIGSTILYLDIIPFYTERKRENLVTMEKDGYIWRRTELIPESEPVKTNFLRLKNLTISVYVQKREFLICNE